MIGKVLSEEQVDVGVGWELVGAVIGAADPQCGGEDAANPHCISRSVEGMPGPSLLTQRRMHYFSPETAAVERLLVSKIISGDNLPVLLVSKLTSSDPPYLQRGQKALSPLCFYTGINRTGCPPVKI